jgi:hypothetical protein
MIDPVSLAALDATANDYESAASVCGELSAFLGKPISEPELFSVLRSLEAQRLVKAYRAAPDGKSMLPTASSVSDSPSVVWFSASAEGRRLLEREWEPTFGSKGARQ